MSWACRIECGEGVGTGTIVASRLLLTSWHLIEQATAAHIPTGPDSKVALTVLDSDRRLDVALLELDEDESNFPDNSVLIPRELWRGEPLEGRGALAQICTSDPDTPRSLRIELRPAAADAIRVEFAVPGVREGVQLGYSGGPVIERSPPGSRPRVVGIIRGRDPTSIDALDLAGRGWMVPMERIAERFDEVMAWLERPVERDSAWSQHWEPRSRGVFAASEPGFFFSGREEACAAVERHLGYGAGLLVVTGERGAGKSAILSRVVALSCDRYRNRLRAAGEEEDLELAPRVDAATCARDKEPNGVAREIASQLGLGCSTPQELIAAIALERPDISIVVDAIDESSDPNALMTDLITPLTDARARVAVGALAARIDAPDAVWVDLGVSRYADDAITPYIARRLLASGRYSRADAPVIAHECAERAKGNFLIAELTARVLSTREALDISVPRWQESLPSDLTGAFRAYLSRFGEQRKRVVALLHPLAHARGDGLSLEPPDLWLATANALRPDDQESFSAEDIRAACRNASDYLITAFGSTRRLYHDGLASAIRTVCARERLASAPRPLPACDVRQAERASAERFLEAALAQLPGSLTASADTYAACDPYLLRHLPTHLAELDRARELLDRPGLLLTGNRTAIRSALGRRSSGVPAKLEAECIAVGHAMASPHSSREQLATALSVALRRQGSNAFAASIWEAALEQPDHPEAHPMPYELVHGGALPSALSTITRTYAGVAGSVVLTATEWRDTVLLICGSGSGELQSWTLDGTPKPLAIADAHAGAVKAVDVVHWHGAPLLLSGGEDGALRSWRLDGAPGPLSRADAHPGGVNWIATTELGDELLMLTGGWSGTLRSWWPDGSPGPILDEETHTAGREAIELVEHEGRELLVAGGWDGSLSSWWSDGSSGPLAIQDAHHGRIHSVVCVEESGAPLLVTGGWDGALRSWRLDGTSGPLNIVEAHGGIVRGIVPGALHGRPLLITYGGRRDALRSWWLDGSEGPLSEDRPQVGPIHCAAILHWNSEQLAITGGSDGMLHSWYLDGRPGPLDELAHAGVVESLCPILLADTPLLVSRGEDGALRTWRLDKSMRPRGSEKIQLGPIRSLRHLLWENASLLVTGDGKGGLHSLRLDGAPGPLSRPAAHVAPIKSIAVVDWEQAPLLISGDEDGALRSWKLDGSPGPIFEDAHKGAIQALVAVQWMDAPLVVSGGLDGTLCTWSLGGDLEWEAVTQYHRAAVEAIAVVPWQGSPLLVSGYSNGALRSSWIDGSPGPIDNNDAHADGVASILVTNLGGRLLLITYGCREGNLRTWWLDGSRGPLAIDDAHDGLIHSAVVVENGDAPLLASGGLDRALRLWKLDGSGDPLVAETPQFGSTHSMVALQRDGAPLVVAGGWDGTVRSSWLDGSQGPITAEFAHAGATRLVVVELEETSIVVSAGSDGVVLVHR